MRQPNFRRGRGRGSPRRAGGGRNQTFDSNGPNVKVRGTAAQVLEKYLALARDAAAAGDRVMAENYYQHAEHYHRVINANGAAQARDGGSKGGNGQLSQESGSEDASKSEAKEDGAAEQTAKKPEKAPAADKADKSEPKEEEEQAPA